MSRLPIVLAHRSRLFRETLTRLLEEQEGFAVVAQIDDPLDLLLAVGAAEAKVAIVEGRDPRAGEGFYSHLLLEYPDLCLLELDEEGGAGQLYRLAISRRALQADRLESLVEGLKRAVGGSEDLKITDLS